MFKIIICDDELITRNGLTKLINSIDKNFNVIQTCSNGLQAISTIKKLNPDIVIIDINMPNKNGLEVIQEINATNSKIKFIILSGYSNFEYAQKECSLNVVDYLLKPINITVLKQTLYKCCELITNEINTSIIVTPKHQDNKLINNILTFINDNYLNSEFSLEYLSLKYHISTSYLSKMIKAETNYNFSELITNKKIDYAKKLILENPNTTINEISLLCAFSSQHYFSKVFKATTNYTPNEYKNINNR